jgi:hypothetical protein
MGHHPEHQCGSDRKVAFQDDVNNTGSVFERLGRLERKYDLDNTSRENMNIPPLA